VDFFLILETALLFFKTFSSKYTKPFAPPHNRSAAMSAPDPSLAALAASFHCPACQLHFRAPLLLECAHTVCAACIKALRVVEPTYCPVCDAVTNGDRPNFAMAEVTEMAWGPRRQLIQQTAT
jgi:hypothetical protein